MNEVEPALPETRRQEIFLALVETQDQGEAVVQSRTTVAKRFAISESQVRKIEREGLEKEWPPLG